MENEKDDQSIDKDQIAQAEAFAAAFNGDGEKAQAVTPEPTPAPTPEPTPEPTQPPVATPAPTQAPVSSAEEELRKEVRALHGRFGEINRELQTLKTAKASDGEPAKLTPVELKRLKVEYPEIESRLREDIAETLAGLVPKAPDPKEVETLVQQRVAQATAAEAAKLRNAAVTDAHPDWLKDLFVVQDGKKADSASYQAWKKTMSDEEVKSFEQSDNPYQVIRKLNQFYDWRKQQAQDEAKKQQRLKDAIAPTGSARAGPPNLSDDEAMRKGFEEGFAT